MLGGLESLDVYGSGTTAVSISPGDSWAASPLGILTFLHAYCTAKAEMDQDFNVNVKVIARSEPINPLPLKT